MENDPLDEYRASNEERNGARRLIEMMINSSKYNERKDLCYVCQKYLGVQECPICHHQICNHGCMNICSNCQQNCCHLCSQDVGENDPSYVCYTCLANMENQK